MNETFVSKPTLPGAEVLVDPRLEALLALNLLDEEPEPAPALVEPPRFHHVAPRSEEQIPDFAC